MNILQAISAIVILLYFTSCKDTAIDRALIFAGGNRKEIEKTYNFYDDKEKKLAAYYLIHNMKGHYSTCNAQTEAFLKDLRTCDTIADRQEINFWWKRAKENDATIKKNYDLQTLSAEFLTNNIDNAFTAWKNSAWAEDITFELFCETILPYRFANELLAEGWRDSLYKKYSPLIENISDIKQAFAIVYRNVNKQFKDGETDCKHILSVLDMEKMFRGTCLARCIYMGSVMRALGIPVSIDGVEHWANYSTKGHTWIALVLNDGTYTLADNDSIPRKYNPVNSSLFEYENREDGSNINKNSFKKRYAKIFRSTYAIMKEGDKRKKDVSSEYGLTSSISIKSSIKKACLCIYVTGKGWTPIAEATNKNGFLKFENIGDSIIYLLAETENGKTEHVGNPFLVTAGKTHYFTPSFNNSRKVTLTRKYPLTGYITQRWERFIGAEFLLSNDSLFNSYVSLGIIEKTPQYINHINISNKKKYRHLRFKAKKGKYPELANLLIKDNNKTIESLSREELHDLYYDNTKSNNKYHIYENTITIDLGKKHRITEIIFSPYNDDNFVVPDNVYELLFYYNEWKSLGQKTSSTYSIQYNNVPDNALLILKNLTKGKEERIFTYDNGKQSWW